MAARVDYACPDCGGASPDQAGRRDEEDARDGTGGLYYFPICVRCGDTGTLAASEMTASEVEANPALTAHATGHEKRGPAVSPGPDAEPPGRPAVADRLDDFLARFPDDRANPLLRVLRRAVVAYAAEVDRMESRLRAVLDATDPVPERGRPSADDRLTEAALLADKGRLDWLDAADRRVVGGVVWLLDRKGFTFRQAVDRAVELGRGVRSDGLPEEA